MSRDVVFKEDESRDGNIDTNVIGATTIPYDGKDKKDQPSDQEGIPP